MPNMLPFEQLSEQISGATIFLDVDGTLMPDDSLEVSEEVRAKVKDLAGRNRVLLCTNKRDKERWEKLEALLGLPVITKRHKKPSKKVLEEVEESGVFRVVIGDKYLTDGLFARRIRARFLKVSRKLSGNEPIAVKCANLVDDLIWNLTQKLFS